MVLFYIVKGSFVFFIFFTPILLIGILIGVFYLTEENAITIQNNEFSTGFGLSKIRFNLKDIIQLIPDKKLVSELIIVLKDKPEPIIKLTLFQKIINLVSRTKISRNAIRIHDYILKYDFKQLEKEIREEVEKLNRSSN